MISSQRKRDYLFWGTIIYMICMPTILKADFRFGVYLFDKGGGGFDFSEDQEIYWDDPNCDMYWGQFEIPYIVGSLIDIGENNFFDVVEAPIENDLDQDNDYKEKQIYMELNHVYIIKTKENCYVKILIISKYSHAMLWVYQNDRSTNLDWRGTTTDVDEEIVNILSNQNKLILIQNYPNPFNSETIVELTFSPKGLHHVKLNVFNSTGQMIADLVDEKLTGGDCRIKWNGRLNSGVTAPSGVYFINAIIDNKYTRSIRILLMK